MWICAVAQSGRVVKVCRLQSMNGPGIGKGVSRKLAGKFKARGVRDVMLKMKRVATA